MRQSSKAGARAAALVSGSWAEDNLGTPGLVFIETGNEQADYLHGHVPGAVWIGWSEFQDDPTLGLIEPHKFADLLSAKGISNDDTVVIYSVASNLLAALVYWYFTYYGHRSVKLLDGGRRKWMLDKRPLSTDTLAPDPAVYHVPAPDPSVRAGRDEVLAAIGAASIVDVRTPEEYSGLLLAPAFAGPAFAPGNSPYEVAQRSGHIPGAVNLPWDAVVNPDDTFKSDDELTAQFAGLDVEAGVITYCWVGARSAHTWFVLRELLGYDDIKNYDGSWAEYGSLLGVPVERSTQKGSR
ncbi:sulfurtransferase [Nocardia jiangsuensis]|uniref:thiosulfate sulfurtransferase n=1 Tax=Nocardia jiangsuensis TaxID=1691563 RepID=A0ABV8DPH1_9NOCA